MKNAAIAAAALVVTAVAATGCHPKSKATNTVKPVADAGAQPTATPASNDEVRTGLPDLKTVALGTVYFDLDQSALRDDAKAALEQNAALLRDNPGVTVRVEGHADERGSTQYNLALGEKRANSVKTYLQSLGITPSRMEVVSYGEERPADAGHDDAAWSKNRRVELAVTAGSDKVGSSYGTVKTE
jgi:peptidoglycan-associated lipoprotein